MANRFFFNAEETNYVYNFSNAKTNELPYIHRSHIILAQPIKMTKRLVPRSQLPQMSVAGGALLDAEAILGRV